MKITVLGGGTAGWLAAFMVSKVHPGHDVALIESKAVGIIGAGESSTGFLTSILKNSDFNYGCNESEFFKETDATPKLSIHYVNWRQLNHEYIAPIDGTTPLEYGTYRPLMHVIANDIPIHMASRNGYLTNKSLSPFYIKNQDIVSDSHYGLHFDGHLVGQYFKKRCNSVKTIEGKIVDCSITESGDVESVTLDSGQVVESDFFIDATGFSRILPKKMGIEWESYSKYLPVNTAMPFLLEHKEGFRIDPVTVAYAQKSGWMWMVPTQERMGCGYVFDSHYTDREGAQKEIETLLGQEIKPIKFIDFDTGKLKEVWKNNCLFIGLSSSFLEPLEATSIHGTLIQLQYFILNYLKSDIESTCNWASVSSYNKLISRLYDGFKDFISVHYASQRTDSEFWRDISKPERRTEQALRILESSKHKAILEDELGRMMGYAGVPIYNWILAGLGYISKETAIKELRQYGQEESAKADFEAHIEYLDSVSQYFIDNTEFINIVRGSKF